MAQRSVQPRTEQSANAANPQGTINGLARALNAYKVYRSKCRHTPRWLSSAKTGNLEFIQRRLREGQDVEVAGDWGRTALWMAARSGHTAIVAELLAAGANPDLGDSGLDCMTPLHVVAWQGNVEAVRLTNLYLSIHLSIYPSIRIHPSIHLSN